MFGIDKNTETEALTGFNSNDKKEKKGSKVYSFSNIG
jgi:hypothetical protein